MTIFEYLSISASIVLALGVGKLVSAIPYILIRTRFDWVFALVFLFLLTGSMLQWWAIWPVSSHENWTFYEFLLLMSSPVTLYVAAHLLVTDIPSNVESWADHLSSVHRKFFIAVFFVFVASTMRNIYFLESSLSLIGLTMAIALLAGAISNRRSVIACSGFVALAITLYSGTFSLGGT